jgi:hypothetical protein
VIVDAMPWQLVGDATAPDGGRLIVVGSGPKWRAPVGQ